MDLGLLILKFVLMTKTEKHAYSDYLFSYIFTSDRCSKMFQGGSKTAQTKGCPIHLALN